MPRLINYGTVADYVRFTDYINCVKFENVKLQTLTQTRNTMIDALRNNSYDPVKLVDACEAYLIQIYCLYTFMGKIHAKDNAAATEEEEDVILKGRGKKAGAFSKEASRLFKMKLDYSWVFPITGVRFTSENIHFELAAVLFFAAMARFETQFSLEPVNNGIVANVLTVVKSLQEASGLFQKCAEVASHIDVSNGKDKKMLPFELNGDFLNSMSQISIACAMFYFTERCDIDNIVYQKDVCLQEQIVRPLLLPYTIAHMAYTLFVNNSKVIAVTIKRGSFYRWLESTMNLFEAKSNIAAADFYSRECIELFPKTLENKQLEATLKNYAKYAYTGASNAINILLKNESIKINSSYDGHYVDRYMEFYTRCQQKKNTFMGSMRSVYGLSDFLTSENSGNGYASAAVSIPNPKPVTAPIKTINYEFPAEEELAWCELILAK